MQSLQKVALTSFLLMELLLRKRLQSPFFCTNEKKKHGKHDKVITDAVHRENGKICILIIHPGRYGYHPFAVAASAIKSSISTLQPFELKQSGIL
jgi:2,4-dienoyl-CoA reductase (NADPH2)